MQHLRREMTAILDEAVRAGEEFGIELPVATNQEEIKEALSAWKPTVMFYGLYNSGKSTLLNALLSEDGREVADTADRPCTESINRYELGDFKVYDTPGLDAPEEHEELSRKQLEKTHVVVFVVSTRGSFDEEETIRELARIWESGRPLILVLNQKGDELKQVAGKRRKILENLEKYTGDASVCGEVDFLCVNAKQAFIAKGQMHSSDEKERRKGELLWDYSGAADVGKTILSRLMESQGTETLRPAKLMLQKGLDDSLRMLDEEFELDNEQGVYRAIKKSLLQYQQDFIETCEVAVQSLRNTLVQDLEAALRAETPLESFFESYMEQVQKEVRRHAERAQREVELEFLAMDAEMPDGQTPFADAFGLEIDPDVDVNQEREKAGRFGKKMPPMSSHQRRVFARKMSTFFESKEGQKLIKEGLLKLRELNVPYFKGRWERTLGKWAGKIGKGLGIFVQVASVGYEIHQAFKGQEEYEQLVRGRQKEIKTVARRTAREAEIDVMQHMPEIALDIFGPFRELVDGMAAGVEEEQEGLGKLQNTLEALRQQVARNTLR